MICPLSTPLAPSRDARIPAIRRACRGTIPRAGSCTMASVRHLLPSDQQRWPFLFEQLRVTLSASLEGSAATRQLAVPSRSTRRHAEGARKPCKKAAQQTPPGLCFTFDFFFFSFFFLWQDLYHNATTLSGFGLLSTSRSDICRDVTNTSRPTSARLSHDHRCSFQGVSWPKKNDEKHAWRLRPLSL